PAVRMPYLDATGEEVLCTRFRVSLDGKPKVKTKSGDKLRPDRLEKSVGYACTTRGGDDDASVREPGHRR
ncbi:MAG TPA: hypothetical protein VIJ02_01685, partial [Thermoanaerobaculia bacterium]